MIEAAALWNSLPVPVILLSAEDRILDTNPAAEAFLNLSARALSGAPVWDRVMVDAPLEEAYERARSRGTPLFVTDVDVGSGERAPVQCNVQVAPLAGSDGQMLLLIEPSEMASRVTQRAKSDKAAKSAIGMAEMMAHEIKNPLAGIAGAAQLLSMNLGPDDLELTDLIVAETRRIVKLLEQVEQFGNLRPPEPSSVNIHDILDRARRSIEVGVGAHMTLIEDYDPSLPHTLVDGDQMVQVFLNLMKNAAEASEGEGKIIIRTFYEPSLRIARGDGSRARLPLQVEIVDDGPGLPADISGEVFEPFVSGRENGTGLGLALVSKIVGDHNGWISVRSMPGQTVFRLSLPVATGEH